MRYRVLTGLNYPVDGVETRVEPGEIVEDIPASAITALLFQGDIEPDEPQTFGQVEPGPEGEDSALDVAPVWEE